MHPFNDKCNILKDGISTLAHGHRKIYEHAISDDESIETESLSDSSYDSDYVCFAYENYFYPM